MDSRTPLTSFILPERPPRLPKAAASRLMEEGAGEPEVRRGAALLRPFYRPGAGKAGGSRGGRASARAGQRRSRSRAAAARSEPSPSRALGGACGGVAARPACPDGRQRARLRPLAGAGGGRAEGGAGALPPLPPARGPEGSAARQRERAGPRR
ncbi:unnamed protein product [Coccothraustes coccothraustes]